MSVDGEIKIVKKSIGIIIFDCKLESVLLVQKKCTYAFQEFVLGKYDKNNRIQIIEKCNNMTSNEKNIISSFEFEWMWYNLFMCKDKTEHYCKAFGRFYKCFLHNQKLLKSLISQSTKSGKLIWEPPKGRKNKSESCLQCALREVSEETRIKPESYRIIKNKKIKKCLTTNNIKYIINYYIAVMKRKEFVKINCMDKSQSQEISDISWIKITELKNYNINNEIKQAIISIHKQLYKESYKNSNLFEEI